jgi:hypothetical protein
LHHSLGLRLLPGGRIRVTECTLYARVALTECEPLLQFRDRVF